MPQSSDEMETVMVSEKPEVPGIAIQCELISPKGHYPKSYAFDIQDIQVRRGLVRRVYGILIVQLAFTLPCIELLLRYPLPYFGVTSLICFVISCSLYSCFYVWRDWRRHAPGNYFVLILTTLIGSFNRSLYLMSLVRNRWVYAYPVILILEILALILYSVQEKFRFTQIRGIYVIGLVFGFFLLLANYLGCMMEVFSGMACTIEAWYVIYDTHLMLSGRHGYHLQPTEYVFAACNIHCDVPRGLWRLIKMFFINKIIEAIRMFRDCFRTEVC
ncbi:protein lifeguard 2 [Drosophila bipectinata]|uniref:protein lifeguard 2 n=1 Tax=Drosophila bipectinata TaxID=42026 RepID=UPI001C893949|nr:protein lifeguard 2 [Drosophila bipectinata]